jgi:hypothetical protein
MKKIIAISVMFALFAGAVFAETSVSGAIETRIGLFNGSNAEDAKAKIKGDGIAEAYFQMSGTNDDGNMGALLRFKGGDGAVNTHRAFVWWKPIDQVRFFLGRDDDGMFGSDGLVSWNYYASGTGYLSTHNWDKWRAFFPGNWDSYGLAISLWPVDGLEANIVIPTGGTGTAWRINDMFIGGLRLSINYSIEGIGKLYFIYNGATNIEANGFLRYASGYSLTTWDPAYPDAADQYKPLTNGQVAFSFNLTMIEGLQIQPGFSTVLVKTSEWDVKSPMWLGLGVWYDGGEFGVKVRAGYVINERFNEDRSSISFGILPWYKLADNITAYLDVDVQKTMIKDDDDNSPMAIAVTPSVKAGFGSGSLGIGIKIENNGAKPTSTTTYSVPVRFVYSF